MKYIDLRHYLIETLKRELNIYKKYHNKEELYNIKIELNKLIKDKDNKEK